MMLAEIFSRIEHSDVFPSEIPKDLVNAEDDFGWTPLIMAAFNGNDQAAVSLVKMGADITHRDGNDMTALDYATLANEPLQPKTLEMLKF